jgi:hypothetical protein
LDGLPGVASWNAPQGHRPDALVQADLRRQLDACSPNRTTARGRPVPDPRRPHDVHTLTTGELEQARRELQASLALARPCSPIRVPIEAHINAIETELAQRADTLDAL